MKRSWAPGYFCGHEVGDQVLHFATPTLSLEDTHVSFPFPSLPIQWMYPPVDFFLGEGCGLCPLLPNTSWKKEEGPESPYCPTVGY